MFDSGLPMPEPTKNYAANALHHRTARHICSAGTEYSSGGSVRSRTVTVVGGRWSVLSVHRPQIIVRRSLTGVSHRCAFRST